MAAYWKNIDKINEGEKTLQIKAVRADKNSRDVEFFREVVFIIGELDQKNVFAMNEEDTKTFVENHIDINVIDVDIATEEEPPEEIG